MADWLTPKQAAAIAQVSVRTIYAEIKNQRLRATRITARRDLRIDRQWVDQWLSDPSIPVEMKR